MAFTAPTAPDLKTRYPAFAGVADETVTAALDDAGLDVGESWILAHRAPAILALAAHRMVGEGVLASAEAQEFTGGLGTVTELRAGDSTIKFASASQSEVVEASGYARTPYGRRYLELRARSFPPVLVI